MRRKRFDSVKRMVFWAVFLAGLILTGCGKQQEDGVEQLVNASVEQQENAAATGENGDKQTASTDNDSTKKELYQGTYRSCIIQEDAENLYLCGSYRVSKINKETGAEEILWENKELAGSEQEYLYSEGSGLLLEDRIYFIERWYGKDDYEKRALSCVHIDGSGYERIAELEDYCRDGMLLQDGTLYLDGDDKELWYQVYEDGTLSDQDILLADNSNQRYYNNNGDWVVFQREQLDSSGLVEFECFNEKYFLIRDYTSESGLGFTLIDRETMEERELVQVDSDSYYNSVIYMDDTYLYILYTFWQDDTASYQCERIALETGEQSVLFTQEKSGYVKYAFFYQMNVVVLNDYIYYVDEMDGKYYVMRRNIEHPEEAEQVSDAFYDTGIGTIGSVQSLFQKFYSEKNAEAAIFVLNMSYLKVDEQFPGAEAINTYMTDYMDAQVDYAQAYVADMEEWIDPEEIGVPSEFSSDFTGFGYFDNHYISYPQSEYEYTSGAAHGMPYMEGFTFDLQTGERLLLPDIIGNSEEELKEIVTAHFAEKINLHPEDFWDDAVDYVQEYTTYESDFYLTEQGIVFYYGPYELACYAAGFQKVTIPYDEFEMKITLEKAVQTLKSSDQGNVTEPLTASGEGWGLSFGEPGEQPVGNASAAALAQYNAYFMGDADEKVIYLTFDCGYENGNTEPILDALKKHDVSATFFVVGHFLETEPELVKRMVEEGHTVGSHTYHHPDITTLPDKQAFQEEMDAVRDKFKEVTGEELAMYYRPPEGKCNVENLEAAQELGYSTFFWSLAHVDWDPDNQPSHKEAIEKLTTRIHPGAVVLLHNTSQTNGEILDELLTKWEEMGYTVKPLAELIA